MKSCSPALSGPLALPGIQRCLLDHITLPPPQARFQTSILLKFPVYTPRSSLAVGDGETRRRMRSKRRMSSVPTKPPTLPVLPTFPPPTQGAPLPPSSRPQAPPHLKDPMLSVQPTAQHLPASSTSPSLMTLPSTFKLLKPLIP